MKWHTKVVIVLVLAAAVAGVVVLKQRQTSDAASEKNQPASQPITSGQPAKRLPTLVDLGKGYCNPCKQMKPVLKALREEYAGQLRVEYIDLTREPKAGESYSIRLIPTQIFFAADGQELWRHEGVLSKEDILAKWRELGVDLVSSSSHPETE